MEADPRGRRWRLRWPAIAASVMAGSIAICCGPWARVDVDAFGVRVKLERASPEDLVPTEPVITDEVLAKNEEAGPDDDTDD